MQLRVLCGAWGLLACGAASARAQQLVPPSKTEFLDSAYAVLPSAVGARYRRETAYADSVAGTVRTYFLDGKLRSVSPQEHLRKGIAHGTFEEWHPNGQLHAHEVFAHGQRVGELRMYYASGQLKRRESYAAGSMSAGECFAGDGQPISFFAYEVMPLYSEGDGGFQAIVGAVARRVKYPREAIRHNITGRVFVSFAVDHSGQVVKVQVAQGVAASLDAAAVLAVQSLKRFQPGRQDGQPVAVSFTVPITFSIQ